MALRKKKTEEVQAKPVVTQIPLPVSDLALVIDLPDGQKLVVGKLTHGTVIEVATWRGTGRPDSRTNRMMLGMTNAELEAEIQATQDEEKKPTLISKNQTKAILQYPVAFFKWLFNFKGNNSATTTRETPSYEIHEIHEKASVEVKNELASEFVTPSQNMREANRLKGFTLRKRKVETPESEVFLDVDDWLNQAIAKSTQAKNSKSPKNQTSNSKKTTTYAGSAPKKARKPAVKKSSGKKPPQKSTTKRSGR